MRHRFPPLNPLRAFEVTARHMSFTEAADELCVTQSAVSRQVKALEGYLGFELFVRNARGLELTPQAKAYAAALTDAFQQIEATTDELFLHQGTTTLTLMGYAMLINRWLLPKLSEFQIKHPRIMVRTIASSENVDFTRDVVDLGIRYGSGSWSHLHADLLFNDELLPVCSPGFLESAGKIDTPEKLARTKRLHLRKRKRDWDDWSANAGMTLPDEDDPVYFDDLAILYEAAVAGHGIAIGQYRYVEDDLRKGRLVAPFEHVLRRQSGYYLVYPAEQARSEKIQALRDWLLSKIGPEACAAD